MDRRLLTVLSGLCTTTLLLAGCTIPSPDHPATSPSAHNSATTSPRGSGAPTSTPPRQGRAIITPKQATHLRASWVKFVTGLSSTTHGATSPSATPARSATTVGDPTYAGALEVSILPVGYSTATTPLVLRTTGGTTLNGAPSTGATPAGPTPTTISATLPAAATFRAPVALAALRYAPATSLVGNDIILAINSNDFDAAHRLWESLGPREKAAHLTAQVIALTGDTTTRVALHHPETTTLWSTPNQVRFVAGLACVPDAKYVRDCMSPGKPELKIGFAVYDTAQVLSGWINEDNTTTVRQFAILDLGRRGFVAISLVVRAPDGSRTSANTLLTQVARWLHQHNTLPTGRCP